MDDIKQMAKTVAKCIKGDTKKTKEYDTAATVKRVDGGTLYVSIPGGVSETPVKKTIDAKVGDTVQVHVGNGTAWLVGNQTAPPTDDAEALVAKAVAKVADQNATKAKTTADEAQQTANGIKQHFWTDDDGAHITEVTQEEWLDPSSPNYQSGGNLLARSNGIAVRDGLTELASFGDSVLLGKIGGMQVEQTTTGMKFIGSDGYYYAKITADSSSGLDISNTASMLHVRIGNIIELVNDMGEGLQVNATSGDIDVTGKATLGAINGDSLFDYSTVSMTSSSISANASGEVTSSASNKTKYYPIAITNVNISTGQASLRRFYFSTQQSGKAVVKIGLQNDGTSAKTISVSADILWVKVSV